MRVGIPKEIKEDENRVAITPAGVAAFRLHGHEVFIETGAGAGSHIPDEAYARAGVAITRRAEQVWEPCDLVLKVKEPLSALQPTLDVAWAEGDIQQQPALAPCELLETNLTNVRRHGEPSAPSVNRLNGTPTEPANHRLEPTHQTGR